MSDEQEKEPFNPWNHMIQLKSREGSKDYLPVQWRLAWFREKCPQGTIDTEEIEVDLDREVEEEAFVWDNETRRSVKTIKHARGYARYKAIVTDGKGGRATGTKSENAASFPDFAEKAETGSIGRALAALGYGTQFAPDLTEAHRIVDSPVDRSEQVTTRTAEPSVATSQQIESIGKLLLHLKKPAKTDLATLPYQEAKNLIQQLSAEYRETKGRS